MSIRLEKNNSSNQNFITTLYPQTGSTFYFKFTYPQSGEIITKTLTDLSSVNERYNKFVITTLTGSTGLTNIQFDYEGWWNYEVYINSGSTSVLEKGKVLIYSDLTPTKQEYTITTNKYVYKS